MSLEQDPMPPATDPTFSLTISTVYQDDMPRSLRIKYDCSSSRRTARSSRGDSSRSSSCIKHDDLTEIDSDGSLSNEKEQQAPAISFDKHRKGPKHRAIDSLVPSDERFDMLMYYRYYFSVKKDL